MEGRPGQGESEKDGGWEEESDSDLHGTKSGARKRSKEG